MASIKEEQKKDFKEVVMLDGKPNGIVVLQLVDVVAGEFNQGVSISLKKPKA
jgi:predicted nuclease of predicted toxin-antitoxin system